VANVRAFALLAVLAFLLAGCSGGGGGDDPPAAVSSTSTSTGPAPPPVPTTDTLHLMEAPAMSTVVPTGSDVRTPVGFANGGGFGQQDGPVARWAYQVSVPTNVTGGEVHVWVEIKEQMLDSPSSPLNQQCTWRLTTGIGGDTQALTNCVNEPVGAISPGVKELVFTLVLQGPIELEANETITVTLSRSSFSPSPNNAVDALSGSAEHDSRVTLRGLKEPIKA
jgi:hypothetical protein